VRAWSQPVESVLVRSRFAKAFFSFVYFGFNVYIVVVPLIGPYQNANGTRLEIKGWYYIVAVGCIFAAAIVYYYLAFGYRQRLDANNNIYPRRSVVQAARGALPLLHEDRVHDPQYGVRRWVEIAYGDPVRAVKFSKQLLTNTSQRPSYFYWLFGGSRQEHYPNSAMVDMWNHFMGH
jgi:hypothetical protein